MKTIQNKWKEFAIGQYFSFADDIENTVEIFDALMIVGDSEDFDAALEKFKIDVWQPFEDMYYRDFLWQMENCAMTAQRYEAAA